MSKSQTAPCTRGCVVGGGGGGGVPARLEAAGWACWAQGPGYYTTHWWTNWAPAWGYIPTRVTGEEDTLWWCPNLPRII